MQILRTVPQARTLKKTNESKTIGFVPTMGALHDGHMELVKTAQKQNDIVVVSIFVNPKQFAAHEDLNTYPRTVDQDTALLKKLGVDAVFAPNSQEFYPNGFCTSLTIEGPALGLETDYRPHFFSGVGIVVTKLLCSVMPQNAYFGEKDYQQLCVVTQLARDLNLPIDIIACPTIRCPTGLALSSRNAYLSQEEYAQAPTLYTTLKECAQKIEFGHTPRKTLEYGISHLTHHNFVVDYLELRQNISLAPICLDTPLTHPARLLVAAKLGNTRLIDNIAINPKQ